MFYTYAFIVKQKRTCNRKREIERESILTKPMTNSCLTTILIWFKPSNAKVHANSRQKQSRSFSSTACNLNLRQWEPSPPIKSFQKNLGFRAPPPRTKRYKKVVFSLHCGRTGSIVVKTKRLVIPKNVVHAFLPLLPWKSIVEKALFRFSFSICTRAMYKSPNIYLLTVEKVIISPSLPVKLQL